MLPLLPLLARLAQSPDGAEMVNAAVFGGVLHPSGIPLQWWINRAAVAVSPLTPDWTLSFVSWLGGFGTLALLLLLLRRLGVSVGVAVLAGAALAYFPVFALMCLTPEKYTWLALTQICFVYMLAVVVVERNSSPRALGLLGVALGLALAQHSANVILLPPFLYVIARPIFVGESSRRSAWGAAAFSVAVAGFVTAGFYVSLLAQRSSLPWPDWGQLESVGDVWSHVVRQDYGYVQLYNDGAAGENSVSAVRLLLRGLLSWNLSAVLVPLGILVSWRSASARVFMGYLWLILLPGLAVLASTKMPSADLNTVMGYQERYPILLLPLLAVFWAWGLDWLIVRFSDYRRMVWGVIGAFLVVHIANGIYQQRKTDNNLVEIYREQVRSELDSYSLFWTGSDFTAFSGIADAQGTLRFPVKGLIGMPWYRSKVLPQLAPPLARIMNDAQPPANPEDLFRRAINEGFKITVTEPTRFLNAGDLMAMAEQTGVLWNFSATNNSLYTHAIVDNTLALCDRFERVKHGLPREGLWFVREYLDSFKYAFQSAGDYFQALLQLQRAVAARSVAEVLVPGRNPDEWIAQCAEYRKAVGM